MNRHKEENCTVPFCRECLDRIKAVKSKADSLHFTANPPEDLRTALQPVLSKFRNQVWSRGWNEDDEKYINDILRLCEAAALAALPEKLEMTPVGESESKAEVHDKSIWNYGVSRHNQAIATAQANFHSVFGGSK